MTKKKKPRRPRSTTSRPQGSPGRRPQPQARTQEEGNGQVASAALERADQADLAGPAGDTLDLVDTEAAEGGSERPSGQLSAPRTAPASKKRVIAPSEAPRGLFGGLRMPSPFPRFGETLRAAAGALGAMPLLVAIPLLAVPALWLLLIAVGLDHVPSGFIDIMAIPPISSLFDINLVLGTLRNPGAAGIAILFGLIALRAIIWATLVALILDALRRERPSSVSVAVAIRALPATLGYFVANLAAFFLVQTLSVFLGNLGLLLSMFGFVATLYFLTFTPVAAAAEKVPFREAVRRSAVAARFPGSRHIGLVFLYFFVTFIPLVYGLQAPGPFRANPTFTQWALVLLFTLLHLLFLCAFAYRYLAVEDQIPAPRPRQAPVRRR